jgi:hypothetical protein
MAELVVNSEVDLELVETSVMVEEVEREVDIKVILEVEL